MTELGLSFHHVGLACKRIAVEAETHRLLGFSEEGPVFEDPIQRIRGQFMTHGAFRIELLEPLGSDSPLEGHLKRGVKMYHQAFSAPAIQTAIDQLVSAGAHLIVGPVPAVAFGGREVAFLILRTMMLVELIQA